MLNIGTYINSVKVLAGLPDGTGKLTTNVNESHHGFRGLFRE